MSLSETMTAFTATAEMLGKNFTNNQLVLFAESIAKHDQGQVIDALRRVREECQFFSLAEVLNRIDDGRPEAEEAWSLVSFDESETIVINNDFGKAMAVAESAYLSGDKVGAKFAFKEKYKSTVSAARSRGEKVNWFISFGN